MVPLIPIHPLDRSLPGNQSFAFLTLRLKSYQVTDPRQRRGPRLTPLLQLTLMSHLSRLIHV